MGVPHEQTVTFAAAGVVCLWDTNQGRTVTKYKEHRKRTWCVDWSLPQPGLFATASEDYTGAASRVLYMAGVYC